MTGFFILLSLSFLTVPYRILLPSLFAISIHELGHIITILLSGGEISAIIPSAFGLNILQKSHNFSYKQDILISVSGCLANIVSLSVYRIISGVSPFVYISLVYAVFNALPIATLDGGCALNSLILLLTDDENRAGCILKITSGFTVFSLWIFGVYLILSPTCNMSLFFMTIYLFCSVFLK